VADAADAWLTTCHEPDTSPAHRGIYDPGVIIRVLTARVAQHNAGRFEELLRQQLGTMREHDGLLYVKLGRQANGAFEELVLFEEWRDPEALYGWAGSQLTKPRLMPGAEQLADDVRVTHYEALDVEPEPATAIPTAARGATGPR
jgi:quinol monooxygenase YgiN